MPSAFRQTVRGMRDLLPKETQRLRFVEQVSRDLAKLYGYEEVITPVVERYELLAAKIGEENRKRMYVFEDLGGRKVALRPEFTASVARLVSTKMVSIPKPLRLFSAGSLYRYDEPQSGRYREFWQANYELFGSSRPEADAEILTLTKDYLDKSGLRDYYFKTGHVGILRGVLGTEGIEDERQGSIMQMLDKARWDDALRLVKEAGASSKCLDVLKRLFKIRGKDSETVTSLIGKVIGDYPEALKAVENLREIIYLLKASGLNIDITLDAGFARGLEYYTGVIFEVYIADMSVALCGGGRYDRLVEIFGGGKIPAVGVAQGIDRLTLALELQGTVLPSSEEPRVIVIPVDGGIVDKAIMISSNLRKRGLTTALETMGRSVSQALSDAGRRGVTHAVIVGPREMKEGKVVLRDMRCKLQETVSLEELPKSIRS